ncbi:SbcC/MukB-like Walker B domain-containing protein [Cryobacterium melibiosiphilum]|uniref:SbcC/MukB-like Walker B domain-containing protein n=1 Tax=Cryobacterium melibiosiphilum TaxID=995039 RepID=UPI001F473DCC|nr:SbcC/MukB-like Walker B domain-containing protein [Cryobacterium melibiosiphilum]
MSPLGSSEIADRAWRGRCLDTREHVTFMAHEVDLAGRTVNVHDSSAGLSGGQRQKLVIFCLAAALRYQLASDEDDLPTYATIILDEAFDKADSRYTRMAMDVFVEFGFHMILATPERLLQTIEPYVGGITSITNATRRDSRTASVTFRADAEGASPPAAGA